MSQTIGPKAASRKIIDHAGRAYGRAIGYGGRVALFAESRLASSLTTAQVTMDTLETAAIEASYTRAALHADETRVDNAILNLRDEAWCVLGRPRRAGELDYVFPGGARTYTNAPTRKKPMLLRLLATRLRAVASERWTLPIREAWAAEVDELRGVLELVLETHEPNDMAKAVAKAVHRTAIRYLHDDLCSFKRDLQSDGMSRTKIDAIIPDGTTANGGRRKKAAKARIAVSGTANDS